MTSYSCVFSVLAITLHTLERLNYLSNIGKFHTYISQAAEE